MRKYAPTDLIAHDPIWPYSDFEQKAYQLSAEFQHPTFELLQCG